MNYFSLLLFLLAYGGSWFDHVLSWWENRADPRFLFLKYEDMKKVQSSIYCASALWYMARMQLRLCLVCVGVSPFVVTAS